MAIHVALIVLSLVLLFAGAEGLVRGSSSIAIRAGLSPLFVGLTIVAFGTSSPELLVSMKATLAGQGDIAVGNVVGSNSFNIGFILGLTALLCPVPVHNQVIRLDAPIALAVAAILPVFLLDGMIGRAEGTVLCIALLCYGALNLTLARKDMKPSENTGAKPIQAERRHVLMDTVLILGGLALLFLGSSLLVDHAVALAKALGVSQAVIGLTIVAAGTSMPELATSLVAAVRKQPDIAVGNVIGSNIFNILGILGVSSIASPVAAPGIALTDYGSMIGFTLLLWPLLYTGKILHRIEGAMLLGLYST